MTQDRSYYRCLNDKLLLEEAKYNPNAELAIVLAERLLALKEARLGEYKEEWEYDQN